MDKTTEMGRNRTGIDMSPMDSDAMIKGARDYAPSSNSGRNLASIERDYIEHSDPLGSVPMPGTVKGALKTAMDKISGLNPEILINKLGERLAFERSGVRIYDSFITKCESVPDDDVKSLIALDQLRRIRNEEAKHFQLLKRHMEDLGADPTAQTPDADVSAVASTGLMKVIMDPRTNLGQCLEALLSIEMTDHAGWELLIKLAKDMGMDEMAQDFLEALREEGDHLKHIQQWHEQAIRGQLQ